ncbi:MAG: hypothetical protein OEX07_15285 [Gammaproteobacteria bacterium]|nr:hypothetical protein [Gammaproteobacteria bacterium]
MKKKITSSANSSARHIFFISVFVPLLTTILSACGTMQTEKDTNDATFYITVDDKSPGAFIANNDNWFLSAEIVKTEKKPKTYYYNFSLESSGEKYSISDVNYKYGSYGKWRIIDKKKYLQAETELKKQINIKDFPITIKKTGIPHKQLLRISLNSSTNKPQFVNLVFGVNKCLSKTEKEFVCF